LVRELSNLDELSRELIAADTVSHRASRGAMDRLGDRLSSAGFRVEFQTWGSADAEKANLVAVAGPPEPDGLILSGHLDVVPFEDQPGWTRDPLSLGFEGDRVFGRGTTDMKVFLAQCVEAAQQLELDSLQRPVALLFTSDEEISCQGAARLLPEIDGMFGAIPKPSLCWIGEPTSWEVFHAHKGVVSFAVEISGAGGHSSIPDAGVNAISVGAQLMTRIGDIQAEIRATPNIEFADVFREAPYTTLNFGTIRGGTALNMIADACVFNVSYRPMPDEDPTALWERIRTRLLDHPVLDWGSGRAALEIRVGEPLAAPGLQSPLGTPLESALRERLGEHRVAGAPFCTDGGHLAAAGIDSIICGPGDLDQAHQPNESLSRAAYESGTEHIAAVLRAMCGVG
jgi:acetylornithine deacetylase